MARTKKVVKEAPVVRKRAEYKPRPYDVTITVTVLAPNKAAALGMGGWLGDIMIDHTSGEVELNKVSATLKPKTQPARRLYRND